MSYLVPQQPQTFNTTRRRFDPMFWDVDFDISAVATIVTTGANSFLVKGILRDLSNLVGVFWRSKDKWGHPLYSYEQNIDWRDCVLSFDLTYTGCPTISDSANGGTNRLTLTVIDMSGKPYYLYLENFMTSGSADSRSGSFQLDFNTAKAGVLADEDIPWDFIDHVFFGFVPIGYVKGLYAPIADVHFEANFTNISVTGSNTTVGYNAAGLPAHELRIADGYADSYPLTPARVVEQIVNLGYRGNVVLYVGFTQFLSLTWDAGEGRFIIDTNKPILNVPTQQWVTDFCTRLQSAGLGIVISVSFELLKQYTPLSWAQYDYKGQQSESGWNPSSTFVSLSSTPGMNYLRDVALAFVGLSVAVGCHTEYQVGEPWSAWPGGYRGEGPCFYDPFITAEYTSDTGRPVPTPYLKTIYDDYQGDPNQVLFLEWIRDKLGERTLWLRDEVKAAYPGTPCTVLFYTPTISNPLSPMLGLVLFPTAHWMSPNWDYVQIENYEVIEFGNFVQSDTDLDVPVKVLNYPPNKCQYFSGFNLLPSTTFIWDKIDKALWKAYVEKGYGSGLVWARPQICRDGWVYNHDNWASYAAVTPGTTYPVLPELRQLGWEIIRRPVFNTLISSHVSGKEIRSPRSVYPLWEFEFNFEGLKSDSTQTYQQMSSFFQSMKGRGSKFAFRDPENYMATGQYLGDGTSFRKAFTLCRSVGPNYEEPIGAIDQLTAVYIDGVVQDPSSYSLWYNNTWPQILFDNAPADGTTITATFSYFFVCRFYSDIQSFEEFMKNFHDVQSFNLVSVKP